MTTMERCYARLASRYPTRARRRAAPAAAGALILLLTSNAHAGGDESTEQGADAIEHTIIVGLGGAAELELGDGSLHPGANFMVEWEAIENWLEFEVGGSVLWADGGVELPIDLLVKKPFRLNRWTEFMVGVGPEAVRVSTPTTKATYFGGELALDFMFWPWGRRVGLWVEPEYDVVFRDGASSGIGSTGGVLFGW
jgi:hypothetical protein